MGSFVMADSGNVGARGSGKPLSFSKKHSYICIVQIYFSG